MPDEACLRYLNASCLDGGGINFRGVVIRGHDDRPLGALVGVLVEPLARRLRYFVVDNGDPRQYLIPLDVVQLDERERALRIVGSDKAVGWEEFDPGAFREFSGNDAVDAIFAGNNAAVTSS